MISFEDYLQQQLNKEKPEWFDPDGNSPRAVVMRGKIGTLKREFKTLLPSLKSDLAYFWDGVDTPISYFLQVLILPFILPFLPFLRAHHSWTRAIRTYKEEYLLRLKQKPDKL